MGLGDFLSGVLGTNSQYTPSANQAGNPYASSYLQAQVQNQHNLYGQEQGLAGQLQAQAAGQGPNPAQIQYMQNVQNNIRNAQGLASSQRGLNPALAARMGMNAAAAGNQQAAAQSGLMNQMQQLGAQQNLAGLYSGMANQNLAGQGLYNQANTANMQTNAAVANGNQQAAEGIVGGLLNGAGAAGAAAMNQGGMVKHYGGGGDVGGTSDSSSPQSFAGNFLKNWQGAPTISGGGASPVLTAGFGPLGAMGANPALQSGISGLGGMLSGKGGMNLGHATQMAGGPMDNMGSAAAAAPMVANRGGRVPYNFKPGGKVPGRAKFKGNSIKNDTVPAMLSSGEIVLPRSVTMSKDAPKRSAAFVAAVLAQRKKRRSA